MEVVSISKRGKRRSNKIRLFMCQFCSKEVDRKNIYRHEKFCKDNGRTDVFTCAKCNSTFSRKDNMNTHIKSCKGKPSPFHCMQAGCKHRFRFKKSLICHLQQYHGDDIKPSLRLNFPDLVSFRKWKEDEEESTYSYFSKHTGTKNGHSYFYCQHANDSSTLKKKYLRKTNRRRHAGSVKTGLCIAMMHLSTNEDGTCKVEYFPTHSHPLKMEDMIHQPQRAETYQIIDSQIEMGLSPAEIIRRFRESVDQEVPTKTDFITLDLVKKRFYKRMKALRQNVGKSKFEHMLSDEEFDQFVYYDPKDLKKEYVTDDSDVPHDHNLFQTGDQSNLTKVEEYIPLPRTFDDIPSGADYISADKKKALLGHLRNKFDKILKLIKSNALSDNVINMVSSSIDNVTKKCDVLKRTTENLTSTGEIWTEAPFVNSFANNVQKQNIKEELPTVQYFDGEIEAEVIVCSSSPNSAHVDESVEEEKYKFEPETILYDHDYFNEITILNTS